MLKTDLIDIINSGKAWAFVGSGASVDAGCPTWKGLVEKTVAAFDEPTRKKISNDDLYELAFNSNNFPACFSRIEWFVSRKNLVTAVTEVINQYTVPGGVTKRLADFPFTGYTTTNYDTLLETALSGELGWSSIGNLRDEIRKVSGDASRVVWHIHGGLGMPGRSRLLLTEKDYDDFYLERSDAIDQLKALLLQHRIVFVGFGFTDPEVNRLLKRVGRLCHPARPIYAFLSGVSGAQNEAIRKEFLEKYNVDIIPYRVIDNSHKQLTDLLDVYGALILKRSLKFGQPTRECPSYDPETTGLLLYNDFRLREGAELNVDILSALLKSQILSLLKFQGTVKSGELITRLEGRLSPVRQHTLSVEELQLEIVSILRTLEKDNLITIKDDNGAQIVSLTPEGSDIVANQAATSGRLSDQFLASLKSRVNQIIKRDDSADRVTKTIELFIKESIERRALGVAKVRSADRSNFQSYHMVALLQALPDYMSHLTSTEEAIALTQIVRGILAAPSEAESKYIGLALQARFGIHLLGLDPDTLRAQTRDLSNTLFLLDSSTLIPYLARSSVGHSSAKLLINRLNLLDSVIATTNLLAHEVTEHAQWAINNIEVDTSYLNTTTLQAATGRTGVRSNAFLEGFLEEVNEGKVSDLMEYFSAVAEVPIGSKTVADYQLQNTLDRNEIQCNSFQEWEGFTEDLWHERDTLQDKIAELRIANKTFRHYRQAKAEAEALIIIRNLRNKTFKFDGTDVANAFFISHTRIIDQVANIGQPVTMHPEAALQWTAAITPISVDELGALTDSLLLELAERDLTIIDKSKLEITFSPLINASSAKLEEVLERQHALISQKYGEDAEKAFRETSPLDLPLVIESYHIQRIEDLERKLEREQELRVKAQTTAKLNEKERAEFERLKASEKARKTKARSKSRAQQAKKDRKKKKSSKRHKG